MDMSFEDQIRERAYQIWLAGGMADGQAHEHWVCAEQAVKGEVAAETVECAEPVVIITKAEPKQAKPRKAAAKSTAAKSAAPKSAAPKSATAGKARIRKANSAASTAGVSAEL